MSVTPPGGSGPLRWAKGLFGRSLGLQRRDRALHVVLVEKPRPVGAERSGSLMLQLCDELRARVLVHESDSQAICNVYLAYKALERDGWPGIEALPPAVLERALAEAQVMQLDEPSPLLETLVERLESMLADALAAAAADSEVDVIEPEVLLAPEVSEVSHEEYAFIERSWVGTVPAELDEPRP